MRRFQKLVEQEKDSYVLIAKSAGVVVCAQVYASLETPPKALTLIGSPLRAGSNRSSGIVKLLTAVQQPVLLIQERADPLCSFQSLTAQLDSKPDYFERKP